MNLRLVTRRAVLGTVQEFLGLGAELVALRNFLPQVGDCGPVAARVHQPVAVLTSSASERMQAAASAAPQRNQNRRASS